jgi:SAM-dependent methyltransferase
MQRRSLGGRETKEEPMVSENVYDDEKRAAAYAKLEFPGTYYLAYRDLPAIIREHVAGNRALDFGCGAGRSTRFLKELGFDAVGVDIAPDMITKAKEFDPDGRYLLIGEADFAPLGGESFDLILSAFTFDNIPEMKTKVRIFEALGTLLAEGGAIVNLVSDPAIYTNEWASFSTKDFPENADAKSGDRVKIIITDIDDARPVVDVVWSDESYRKTYAAAGLTPVEMRKPLAREDEPYRWVNETRIAPWVIYVLKKLGRTAYGRRNG